MTRDQLCEISRATGESHRTILNRGFSVFAPLEVVDDPEDLLTLRCPFCGNAILLSIDGPEGLPELAECDRCDFVFDYHDHEVEQMSLAQFLAQDDRDNRSHQLLYA